MLESRNLITGEPVDRSRTALHVYVPELLRELLHPARADPAVQARFRCPHCQQPMDFPSREEARVYARLQAEGGEARGLPNPPAPPPASGSRRSGPLRGRSRRRSPTPPPPGSASASRSRGSRTTCSTAAAFGTSSARARSCEADFVSVDEAAPVSAGQVPFLKSLFKLRATSSVAPPARCRTHTDQLAFYKCQDTARPLCEECAQEKKFGNAVARVCAHCGGHIQELAPPA